MKPSIIPLQVESPFRDNDIIITKTDLTGRITYANRAFMRVSQYAEPQLLGRQHSLIRHPDMPRGVFRLLWEILKAEQEFFGYVKNLAADGRYYWVFANVTPDRSPTGKVVGYFSVRRKPKRSAVEFMERIYREMMEVEQRIGPAQAPEASLAFLKDKLAAQGTIYSKFILTL